MLNKMLPKPSVRRFLDLYKNDIKFKNFYSKLGNPKPFDVTLRDGIQTLNSEENVKKFNLDYKKNLYHEIVNNYFPQNIEVGSLVSKKILPILADSMELLEYVEECNHKLPSKLHRHNHYILFPNIKSFSDALNKGYLQNFSFITSISNSFQKKNTKKNLDETKEELLSMLELIYKKKFDTNDYYKNDIHYSDNYYNVKLYISCINECPLEGKIDNDFIVYEILKYNNMNINNICLSDTCGTLEVKDFEYIVDACNSKGLLFSTLSLHLHVKKEREHIVKQIIHKALDRRITKFDVSLLNTGGCSVTMDENTLSPNLSYELYYESIIEYIEKNKDT